MMIAWIIAAIRLFKHKPSFPRFFVMLLLIECLAALITAAITVGVYDQTLTPDEFKGAIHPFMLLAIWGPYMARSKRVRNTFKQPYADEDESREWTSADKEKFKRLMDAQRQSGP
jgi:hypothetical protein